MYKMAHNPIKGWDYLIHLMLEAPLRSPFKMLLIDDGGGCPHSCLMKQVIHCKPGQFHCTVPPICFSK